MYVLGLSCPSATFALQRGGLVPREWLAAKGYCDLQLTSFKPTAYTAVRHWGFMYISQK